jgi:hypothetical protein
MDKAIRPSLLSAFVRNFADGEKSAPGVDGTEGSCASGHVHMERKQTDAFFFPLLLLSLVNGSKN